MTTKISQFVGGLQNDIRNILAVDANNASVIVGAATSATANLHIVGTGLITSNLVVGTNIGLGDGAVSAPTINFNSDRNTGLYSNAADVIGFATGGLSRVIIANDKITAANALFTGNVVLQANIRIASQELATVPDYTFARSPQTGIYLSGADTLGLATAGVGRFIIDTSKIQSTFVLQGPAGTIAAPAYSHSADTNTGIYNSQPDELGLVTGGVLRCTVSNTAILPNSNATIDFGAIANAYNNITTVNVQLGDGTVTSPSIKFIGDTNTGLYRSADDSIGVTTGGVNKVVIANTNTSFNHGVTTTQTTITDALSLAWDLQNGNRFIVQFGNATARTLLFPSNPTIGQSFEMIIKSGSGTLAYNSYFRFKDAAAPTLGANTSLLFGTVVNATFIASSMLSDIR